MVSKPKRKSEDAKGDLPNSRFKARKYELGGLDGLDGEEDGEDEDGDGVVDGYDDEKKVKRDGKGKGKEKEKKQARMSEPVRVSVRELRELGKDEDEDEYGEDPGRDESNEFLELDNLERRKKKSAERAKAQFMEKFVKGVERDAEGVRKLVGEFENEALVEDKKFLEEFQASYALSGPFRVKKVDAKHENDVNDFSLTHKKGQHLITKALEVISHFDKLAEKNVAKDFNGLLGNEWGKEDEHIAKMLELGKTVGINKFECVMNASKPDIMDFDEIEVQKKFYPVVDGGDAIGWGKEAKKHDRANRKLLKAFERGA
ncbi:hypothetical protein NHQ30_007652 [Ciborinia camelliae]|nr:hypothetical protein NHQ30_007652 [Ciborinia camelliae]